MSTCQLNLPVKFLKESDVANVHFALAIWFLGVLSAIKNNITGLGVFAGILLFFITAGPILTDQLLVEVDLLELLMFLAISQAVLKIYEQGFY